MFQTRRGLWHGGGGVFRNLARLTSAVEREVPMLTAVAPSFNRQQAASGH
jgi:hypothetical protein